ncbi:septation ring formation regulator EzrA [Lysinibacillus louembei]|uniref:Septation ring formation regulator EzrA n=1 Tax=Lysinibacillus louembei TaxID=1470088 RepID=A0ABZ0RSX7_9BACI|nr:septation ring formation regulator EzrA [Lysinibacillus louembei]WPK10615.1 septation ring formation regulator EzrA [Lysinibacillus louembei]
MEYIIIVVVLLLALLIFGLMIRRKHNAEIERLEKEKMQVQHYPIYEELTKVKALNMNGQTEEMFENWRNMWSEVIDVHVVKMDSMLFDAEEYVDRFKFKKASQIEREIEEYIVKCETIKVKIIKELEELIGSEEKNRIEVEQLKEYHRSARKTILAHQYSFGPALEQLEKRLEQFVPKFEEFDQLTAEGNYLQAREIILTLNGEAQSIFALLSDIPTLLTEIQTKIPTAIQELRNGQKEMEEQKYYLRHLELTDYLNKLEEELVTLKQAVADLNLTEVAPRIDEINDEIDNFYDLLEKEVVAKKFVDRHCNAMNDTIHEVVKATKEVHDEAAYVQHSYRLPDKEAEVPKQCLKQLEVLQKRYELLAIRVEEEKSAYSSLQEELQEITNEMERIQEEQEKFSNMLKNLRIDENNARKELDALKKLLQNTERMLHKANIPGVPEEMDARLEEAEEHIFIVVQSLQEIPLNMEAVHSHLLNAKKCIEDVHERAEEMITNVMLIERMIQYGNRYRATNATVNARLAEAEEAFHQFRYVKALEDAAHAVESIEPGAIKRIEALVQEELLMK